MRQYTALRLYSALYIIYMYPPQGVWCPSVFVCCMPSCPSTQAAPNWPWTDSAPCRWSVTRWDPVLWSMRTVHTVCVCKIQTQMGFGSRLQFGSVCKWNGTWLSIECECSRLVFLQILSELKQCRLPWIQEPLSAEDQQGRQSKGREEGREGEREYWVSIWWWERGERGGIRSVNFG